MRIVSWNVNGLRTMRPVRAMLDALRADIVCVQETRVSGARDPELEALALVDGYDSFFSSCSVRGGYSGVATFCKRGPLTPVAAGEGLGDGLGGAAVRLPGTDAVGGDGLEGMPRFTPETLSMVKEEGRCVVTDHGRFVLINVYAPAVSVESRGLFKMQFLHALRDKVDALRVAGRSVIIAGDFNICPARIDSAEPIVPSEVRSWETRPSRVWLRSLLSKEGADMVDSFRAFHPDARDVYSCWSEATRARENNFGVRIDLITMDRRLFETDARTAEVMSDVQGSDHCPVAVELYHPEYIDARVIREPPPFCSRFLPRFLAKQTSIRDMLRSRAESASGNGKGDVDAARKVVRRTRTDLSLPSRPGPAASQRLAKRPRRGKQMQIRQFFPAFQPRPAVCQTPDPSSALLPPADSSEIDAATEKPTCVDERNASASSTACAIKSVEHKSTSTSATHWRKLLTGPPPPPLCKHREACKLKTVGKTGPNRGRTFWSCNRAAGRPGDREANCNWFQWAPYGAGAKKTLPK